MSNATVFHRSDDLPRRYLYESLESLKETGRAFGLDIERDAVAHAQIDWAGDLANAKEMIRSMDLDEIQGRDLLARLAARHREVWGSYAQCPSL